MRRAQLLDVALDVFTRGGYQGTSVEDIAVAAGVTRPLMYRYFTDKDDLYLELVRGARAALDESLLSSVADVVLAGGSPESQLRAGMVAYFTFVRDRGPQWDLLFGPGQAVAGSVAEEMHELRFDTADKIAGLIGAAVPTLPVTTAYAYAHGVSGAGEQLAIWWRRHQDVDLDEIVELHLNVVWPGLRSFVEQ